MLINEDTTMVEAGDKEACFSLVQHSKTKARLKLQQPMKKIQNTVLISHETSSNNQ